MIDSSDFSYELVQDDNRSEVKLGEKVDIVVKDITIGSFPAGLGDKLAEVLVTISVTSGAETRSWSQLVKDFRKGGAFFDPTCHPFFVADDLPVDRKGVFVAIEMQEVDNRTKLKKALQAVSAVNELVALIPTYGATVGTVANVSVNLVNLLSDEVGRCFYQHRRNFNVAGAEVYHLIRTLRTGPLTMQSGPRAGQSLLGSKVVLEVITRQEATPPASAPTPPPSTGPAGPQ